jgi:hypothetical protein
VLRSHSRLTIFLATESYRHPKSGVGVASINKDELAVRLGLRPIDLISREVAAQMLNREHRSLANKATAELLPGFYNLSGKGVRSGTIFYRTDWIEDFRAWSAMGRAARNTPEARAALGDKICYGPQSLPESNAPEAVEVEALTFKEILLLIDRWKYRELHHRIEAVWTGEKARSELAASWRDEQRRLLDHRGEKRTRDDPLLDQPLLDKIQEVISPGKADHPERLKSLMLLAWQSVLDQQKSWLERLQP